MGALSAAHRLMIIHRDVTPQNIILSHSPLGKIVPKLIDFGISKFLSGSNPLEITKSGVVLGTPYYMSPERFLDNIPLDARADIWSTGVLIFRMLAGHCPFVSENLFDLCAKVTGKEPPRLERLVEDLPEGFGDILHKALKRNPDERYESMEAFLVTILSCPSIEPLSRRLADKRRNAIPYQRAHERYPIVWQTTVKCEDWDGPRSIRTANVSRGGVFLSTTQPLKVGMRVCVTLELPNRTHLELKGSVARVNSSESALHGGQLGVGIKFDPEHELELSVLEQMAVAHQEPRFQELLSLRTPPKEIAHTKRKPIEKGIAPEISKPTAPKLPAPRHAPKKKPELAEAVGIDFGTSYGSISIAFGRKVYLITDEKKRALHPSIVSYPSRGLPLAGWEARERVLVDPERTISSIKRVLGRQYKDPSLEGYLTGLPYQSTVGPNQDIVFEIDGVLIAPVQVAAQVFEHLRHIGERRIGRAIKKAVVSVPVSFNEKQRQAIKKGATMAGLEVISLLEEPIAGAKSYGHGQGKKEIVAVYDFGGGTFDFSILALSDNIHRVLATSGDPWLGGDDFDIAIAQWAANWFWRQTKVDIRKRAVEWQRLLYAAEQTKRVLSASDQAELLLPQALTHMSPVELRHNLSRAQVEVICQKLFVRSLELCREALKKAGLKPERIDRLVLTGGISRMPFIQKGLAEFLKTKVTNVIDPDQAVCLGAGVHAATLVNHEVESAARKPVP